MKPFSFGAKHLLGLLVAILISTLIFLFTNEIRKLEEFGYIGAFFIMLLNNATLFLPGPGLVFIFVLGGTLPNPLLIGIAGGLGSVLGEMVGYIAGANGKGAIHDTKSYVKIKKVVDKYGTWAILLFAIVPNPLFDIVGLVAGVLGIKWWKFILAAGLGMIIKTTTIAYLGSQFIK